MSESLKDIRYAVLVTERPGGFELRIRELLLIAEGRELQLSYDDLLRRKQQVIDWALRLNMASEFPHARTPSLFDAIVKRSFLRSSFARLKEWIQTSD